MKLIRPTRRQRGNLSYSFYQNEENQIRCDYCNTPLDEDNHHYFDGTSMCCDCHDQRGTAWDDCYYLEEDHIGRYTCVTLKHYATIEFRIMKIFQKLNNFTQNLTIY